MVSSDCSMVPFSVCATVDQRVGHDFGKLACSIIEIGVQMRF